jgi:hypothetical protein
MDFDFDQEWLLAIGMGLLEGFIVMFMMKYSGMSFGFRIFTALISVVAGTFVTKFIISR